jgi:hypothetical protein
MLSSWYGQPAQYQLLRNIHLEVSFTSKRRSRHVKERCQIRENHGALDKKRTVDRPFYHPVRLQSHRCGTSDLDQQLRGCEVNHPLTPGDLLCARALTRVALPHVSLVETHSAHKWPLARDSQKHSPGETFPSSWRAIEKIRRDCGTLGGRPRNSTQRHHASSVISVSGSGVKTTSILQENGYSRAPVSSLRELASDGLASTQKLELETKSNAILTQKASCGSSVR